MGTGTLLAQKGTSGSKKSVKKSILTPKPKQNLNLKKNRENQTKPKQDKTCFIDFYHLDSVNSLMVYLTGTFCSWMLDAN